MEYAEFRAMNSAIVLAAEGEPPAVSEGFKQVKQFIQMSEARFTRFSEASELSALNRSAGSWDVVSPELYALVRKARLFVEQTAGLFDPSILSALERAGYDRSMDDMRAGIPGITRPAAMPAAGTVCEIEFDPARRAIRLPRGLRLDLGGIAKGWIAERAAHRLAEYAPVCGVSAGGDMQMVGVPAGDSAWEVALEDPRDPDNTLTVLRVGPGALATSAITKRRWEQAGRAMHHLIDPRTGQPAQTDWLSVTVCAPDAVTAEVFAKVLLIAGSEATERIAACRGDIRYIAVDANGVLSGLHRPEQAFAA